MTAAKRTGKPARSVISKAAPPKPAPSRAVAAKPASVKGGSAKTVARVGSPAGHQSAPRVRARTGAVKPTPGKGAAPKSTSAKPLKSAPGKGTAVKSAAPQTAPKAAPTKRSPIKGSAVKPAPSPAAAPAKIPAVVSAAKPAAGKAVPAKAAKSTGAGRKGRGDSGSEANLHKRVDSERIALHIAAFEKSGGRVEKLGVTRVLQKVTEAVATAPAQVAKTGSRRR